jgi:hypothetical protein
MQDVTYLTSQLERTKLSEKMIKEDLSRVDECVTHSIHKLGLDYERCENKGEISTKFVPSSTYNDEEETLKVKQIPNPPNPKSSFNLKRGVKRESPKPRDEASDVRELRGGMLSMLETHIVISSLITCLILILMFHLTFTLVLRLTLLHVLFLSSFMDLSIAHMVSVHERTVLSIDDLVTTHVLVVVVISRVGLVFLLEDPTPTLSQDTWMVHVFPIVVHVPFGQVVSVKGCEDFFWSHG